MGPHDRRNFNKLPGQVDELEDAITTWADSISPLRKPKDAVVKLVSESAELLDAVLNEPAKVEEELADVFFLLLDLAAMHDINLVAATWAKLEVNRNREWVEVDGVIRRVK